MVTPLAIARSSCVRNAILGQIVAALFRGDRVELRGFGAFGGGHRDASEALPDVPTVGNFVPGLQAHRRRNREVGPGDPGPIRSRADIP